MLKKPLQLLSAAALAASVAGYASSANAAGGLENFTPLFPASELPKAHLKVIGPWNNSTTWHLNARPFWEEELPKAGEGRITVDLTSMTEMGLKGPEIFRLVKLGVTDIASTVTGYAAGEVPELDGYDLSGVIQDIDTLKKATDAFTPVINRIMSERIGVQMISLWPTVQQSVWCAVPIDGIADLKGKKIRVFAATQADFLKAVGASPVTMAFSEVVPALQRKVVDCAVTGTLSGNIAKWPEVATHLYPINVGWSLWITTVNNKSWARVPEEVQKWLVDARNDIMVARAWEIADVGTNQGIWCSTGSPKCDKEWAADNRVTLYDRTEVPYTAADDKLRRELVEEIALPEFAKRCGADCVKAWNDTIGEVVGMTARMP